MRAIASRIAALLMLTLLGLVPAGAAAQERGKELFFPADQFDALMYAPRQTGGQTDAYESVLMDLRDANFEPLARYDAADEIRRLADPVGLLKVLLNTGKYTVCTASVIDQGLILTNWHCLPKYGSSATRAVLQMGFYQADDATGVVRYPVALKPVETSEALDYAILKVTGDLSRWGRVRMAAEDPPANRALTVIHHPQGFPKQVTQRGCLTSRPPISEERLMHKCDTLPGSSGAPVFFGSGGQARW